MYAAPSLAREVPVILPSGGAGVVDAVGDGVSQFEEDDRVTNTFSQRPPEGLPAADR